MSKYMPEKSVLPIWLKNIEFLPMFYFIPIDMLQNYDKEFLSIPRIPKEIIGNKAACDLIESDRFLKMITKATADMVGYYMFVDDLDVYSKNDPAYLLTHTPEFWAEEFVYPDIVTSLEELFSLEIDVFQDMPEDKEQWRLRWIMPSVMLMYNMYDVIRVTEEFRCFEDFNSRKSRQKIDFYRKWYHTRTKHPMVSLEEYQEVNARQYDGQRRLIQSEELDAEEVATSQVLVEEFMATLSEKDKSILRLRMEGNTLESIAEKLGYRNHSGVLKRIRIIGQAYEKFTGEDYGFSDNKIV